MLAQANNSMQKIVAFLLMSCFLICTGWASVEVTASWNAGVDPPSYINELPNLCPRPVNCAYGANFMHLSDANKCKCCDCHGGALGCTGGAQGFIICGDGTYAQACHCQFSVNVE